MRITMGRLLLAALGMPRVPIPPVDAKTEAAYQAFTAMYVDEPASAGVPLLTPPGSLLGYTHWLAAHRDVLFHGGKIGGLAELSTERKSRDKTDFGDQRAVYASDAPIWALFFAVVERGEGFESMRNGAVCPIGQLHRRRYFMSVNEGVPASAERSPGFLYVIPRASFVADVPFRGMVDTAHWISRTPVRPYLYFAVEPGDFPLPIRRHNDDESLYRTMWRAGHP